MAAELALAVVIRWMGLVAFVALVGGLVVGAIVPPGGTTTLERRRRTWTRTAALLLVAASVGELLLRARTMAGGDGASATRLLPLVLTHTHFGVVWCVRAGMLAMLLALIDRDGRGPRTAAYAGGVVVALTTTLTGHAADRGDASLAVLIDWLHVLAAATWTGGLLCLSVVVLPEAARWPGERRIESLRRFSTLAGWCLLVVVGSGIANASVEVTSLRSLVTTRYGRVLATKVAIVATMAWLGIRNRRALHSRGPRAAAGLVRRVAWEAALALVVIGCTAILTESAPPPATYRRMSSLPNRYEKMIEAAFHERWSRTKPLIRVNADGTTSLVAANDAACRGNRSCRENEYSLVECNFSLFFGIAVQLYEATLVSDDTPWDRFRREHPSATDPALNPWGHAHPRHVSPSHSSVRTSSTTAPAARRTSGANCHEQDELTDTSIRRIATAGPVRKRDGNVIDRGFHNIGVRPTADDLGTGRNPAFGPLSFTRRLFPDLPPVTSTVRAPPFDHPQLFVPNGHPDDSGWTIDANGDGIGAPRLRRTR
jgi:putative copper export protein